MEARQSLSAEERRAQAEGRMAEALDHFAAVFGSLVGCVQVELELDDSAAGEIRERLLG